MKLFAILLILVAAVGGQATAYGGLEGPGDGRVRDFRLQNPDGRVVGLGEFRGRFVLLFFGFTQCPDVCPTALARAVEIRKKLGPDGQHVQVVFITVDPERDTAELLKAYTAAFDPSFVGLRGDPKATEAVVRNFNAAYRKVATGSSYSIEHSALTYVLDPEGRLRTTLKHSQSTDDYVQALKLVIGGSAASSSSKSAAR